MMQRCNDATMRVFIEAPEGWGPTRKLIGQLEQLGYRVTEWRGAVHELELS
jgi:hypothetical protein